jgi:hypothetical protein
MFHSRRTYLCRSKQTDVDYKKDLHTRQNFHAPFQHNEGESCHLLGEVAEKDLCDVVVDVHVVYCAQSEKEDIVLPVAAFVFVVDTLLLVTC